MSSRSSWRALGAASLIAGAAGLAACGDNLTPDVGEPTPGTIALVPGGTTVDEGGTVTARARRTGSDGAVTVSFATRDDTAIAGADYEAATGMLAWRDGEEGDKTFTVTSLVDLTIEGDEALVIAIADPTGGATLEATRELAITITDDDRAGDTVALTSADRIVTFDRAAPGMLTSSAAIMGLASGERLLGIDRRPADGLLYAVSGAGRVYTVDAATGAATMRSTLAADPTDPTLPFVALAGTQVGVDFNPVVDRLRVVTDTGQNLRINADTGATITDLPINGGALGYGSAAYTNAFATACRTTLYAIDVATDRLLIQSPPNDGVATAVGAGLGIDATALAGFDVTTDETAAGTAIAALTVGGASGLYTIDLAAGTATAAGAVGLEAGETVVGVALSILPAATPVAQPPGDLYGLTAAGDLISVTRTTPGRACSRAAISGLAAGDVPVGIDFRPSTGVLYLLTNAAGTGKLYTLAPATGAATAAVTLSQPLAGTDFGMDFNPTGPVALRIISDTGQNLRVTDVATGATTVDTSLTGGGGQAGASAAAYTDAIQGAGTTTLYAIDSAADRLRLQNPPNAGVLNDVGPLGIDVTGVGGFDIDGRDNVAYAAIEVPGGAATTLHTINLTTGAASAALGAFAAGDRIRGLTRPTPTTTLFGVAAGNTLVRLSLADPSIVTAVGVVSGLGAGEDLIGLDVRPSTGVLYGVSNQGGVFAIDPATATTSRTSMLSAEPTDPTLPYAGLSGADFGLDFNPTGPVALRIVSDTEQNLRVPNVATGATFSDTPLVRAPRTYTVGAVAYGNNVAGATTTALYALDAAGDRLVAIAPPNNGVIREIGLLGADATADATFEVVAADTGLAVLPALGADNVYGVNLVTGAATLLGDLAVTGTVIGLAAPVSAATPPADSPVFAVTSFGELVRFARNAPGARTSIGTINVGILETIVGADVRPSTGELWVLTTTVLGTARLYTVSTTTATATLRATLAADPTDTSAPYSGLIGVGVAMDFNPTGPVALRIITDTLNLRVVDPTTGATFTDAPLAVPAPDTVGAAYTNSFPAPGGVTLTTTLYVLDAATASLAIQTPPNDGVLVPVGALSPSLTFAGTGGVAGTSGFDIGGGNNGLALAVLQRTNAGVAEAFSRLYRINLATGAATELGTGVGGSPLRGLAITIR